MRIKLAVDAQPVFDISDKLALSIIRCHFGEPIEHCFTVPDPLGTRHVVKLTLSEVES